MPQMIFIGTPVSPAEIARDFSIPRARQELILALARGEIPPWATATKRTRLKFKAAHKLRLKAPRRAVRKKTSRKR
jgi:hypothetical protein